MTPLEIKLEQVSREHPDLIEHIGVALSGGMWVAAIRIRGRHPVDILSPPCTDPHEALGKCYALFLVQSRF